MLLRLRGRSFLAPGDHEISGRFEWRRVSGVGGRSALFLPLLFFLLLFHPFFLSIFENGLEALREVRFFAGVAGTVVAAAAKRLGETLDSAASLRLGVGVAVAAAVPDFAHQAGDGIADDRGNGLR